MRKMATIRQIEAINSIEGADAIDIATIGGWKVVIKKGEYSVGDSVVYCEVDSFIPAAVAPFLIKNNKPRIFNGVEGERLRTARFRGQISQGLVLALPDELKSCELGADVSEFFGIVKYEPPIPAQLAGMVKGLFPSFLQKTDQERVQNLAVSDLVGSYFVTEKLEGTSATYFYRDGEFGVCSRNLELAETDKQTHWVVANKRNAHV